jgi:hypothetical protein
MQPTSAHELRWRSGQLNVVTRSFIEEETRRQ